MPLSEAMKKANKKYDDKNMKYQTVKLKLCEYELLDNYCKSNNIPKNGFIRNAIVYAIKNNIM